MHASKMPLAPPKARKEQATNSAGHRIRRMLTIGANDDASERAADAVADRFVADNGRSYLGSKTTQPVDSARASMAGASATGAVPAALAERLDRARQGGVPLEADTRAALEPRFGFDFSRVRVHADAASAQVAQEVHSRAFTLGADLFFAPGQYAPHSRSGRHLLAHELTHVVQQHRAANTMPRNTLVQRAPGQTNSGQTEIAATVPTPNRPTSAPPSGWIDADFEAYLRWALELEQRPPAESGIASGWKGLETGRSAGYLPGSAAPASETGLVFSTGQSREFVSGEPGIGSGDTTTRVRSGVGTRIQQAWVDLPAFGPNSDLVVKAHTHTTATGADGVMSYQDARNFFEQNPSAGRVEFVFDRRVDLASKPDASITGYLYGRDAIKGSVSLDKIDSAFGVTTGGTLTPLESPSALLDVFRTIEPSAQISRFKYSTSSGFVRSKIE